MQALADAARRKNSVLVVGLDPDPARLPGVLEHLPEVPAVVEFCRGILDAVEPYAAAVKIQAAYFERLGPLGMEAYGTLISDAAARGMPVIADVKRGDIGPVAGAYAEAHLSVYGATCVTVNPYMGADAVVPFLEEVRRLDRGGGVFVLVATSNPSAECFQGATEPPLYEVCRQAGRRAGRDRRRPLPRRGCRGRGYPTRDRQEGARAAARRPVPRPRLRSPGRRGGGPAPTTRRRAAGAYW